MAEAYSGLVGAYGYALRQSGSWLFRTYVIASAAFGVYIAILLLLAVITWIASPVAFGERAFLGVIGLFLLVPLFTPVLVAARRHRRGTDAPEADRWLAVGGFGFVVGIALALFISDPSSHAAQGPFGPVAAWVDRLPDSYGLVPPVLAAAFIAVIVRLTRPSPE